MLVYDDATVRDAAIPSPADGMVVGMEDTDAIAAYLNSRWMGAMPVVLPSGDTSGATDQAKIQAVIDDHGSVKLVAGTYYIDDTITLTADYQSLIGSGRCTLISPVNDTFSAIKISNPEWEGYQTVADLRIDGGNYGIELNDTQNLKIRNVGIKHTDSHGIYGTGDVWIVSILDCTISDNGGDGINVVSTDGTARTGNALSVVNCDIEHNTRHGIKWGAAGLSLQGNCIEGNTGSGVKVTAASAVARAVAILGNYFELNGDAEIELEASDAYQINGGAIDGNRLQAWANTPVIKMLTTGSDTTSRITRVRFGAGNMFGGASNTTRHVCGNLPFSCVFETTEHLHHDMSPNRRAANLFTSLRTKKVVTDRFLVMCDEDKTEAVAALVSLAANSIIHDVAVRTIEAMNGTGVKTFQVGVSGNAGKYIHLDDFNPASEDDWVTMTGGTNNSQKVAEMLLDFETEIVVTWTNTGGTPTAGRVAVSITYSESTDSARATIPVPT